MIISLIEENNNPLFANNSHFYEIDPSKVDTTLLKKTKTYKEYQITFNHKEITVFCIVYRDDNNVSYAYIPSYILPRRAYPVAVYLYAIALYLSSKLSMRETAAIVKKKFGLATFSHSTISRVLKRVSENMQHVTLEENAAEVESKVATTPTLRTDRAWSESTKLKYLKALKFLNLVLEGNEFSNGSIINYDYHRRTKKYII